MKSGGDKQALPPHVVGKGGCRFDSFVDVFLGPEFLLFFSVISHPNISLLRLLRLSWKDKKKRRNRDGERKQASD